jgi:hypothetical protein
MWSKTRQILRERLADSLKYRVDYFCYNIRRHDWYSTTFGIDIDDEKIPLGNFHKFYNRYYDSTIDWDLIDEFNMFNDPEDEYEKDDPYYYEFTENDYIFNSAGAGELRAVIYDVHKYLNDVDMRREFKNLVEHKRYILVMFGILDRRVGRRSIQWLNQRRDTLPEWMYRFIDLRIEAEGWNSNKTEREG